MVLNILLLTVIIYGLAISPQVGGQAVMSIDLGSEYMKAAIVKPGVPMEIVLNRESKRKTPMVVAMRDDERLFSDPALATAVKFPSRAFRFVRDLLGKRYEHPVVKRFQQWFPHYNLVRDEETGMVVFSIDENTSYTVEELVAMILEHARHCAEVFADHRMKDVVVTVPIYFNQAERRALVRAVQLAGLNLLQLMSDNAAVALNYGIFRRSEFTNVTQYFMFYDVGSTCTTATIVGYQLVKTKVAGMLETDPQLVIKGVGFDSTLGGIEMTLRLRNHLAAQFTKYKKTKSDVYVNERAMAKLWKEAERLKQILSANTDYVAQVEGLLDDEDFRVRVTREQFEEMCSDLFDRLMKPVADALKFSQITPGEINDVLLMGAGTRMPLVQTMLRTFLKRDDLGKSINTDEAAALGAVYQAAHLTVGFKVKRFIVKEAVIYPVVVQFERQSTGSEDGGAVKTVNRTLFGHMNPYPQKKVMTFNKHNHDFSFNVSYGDLSHLGDDFQTSFDQHRLLSVGLTGVEAAHGKNAPNSESKGVKAHFKMDDSGILHLDGVESVFEKAANESDDQEESTWSKIGDALGGLFGTSKTKEATANATEQKTDEKTETSSDKTKTSDGKASPTKEDLKSDDKEKSKADDLKKANKTATEDKNDTAKLNTSVKTQPKPVIIKENITVSRGIMDSVDPSPLAIAASRRKLSELRERDLTKQALEKAKNELEAFIYDMQDKLSQDAYVTCSLETERSEISQLIRDAEDWQLEQTDDATKEVFIDKHTTLKKRTKDLEDRVQEYVDRPKNVEDLRGMIKHGRNFTLTVRNLTKVDPEVLTEIEMTTLEKLINDTEKWLNASIKEQEETPLHKPPVFTRLHVVEKGGAIAREIQYLVTKIMSYKKKPPKAVDKNETMSQSTNTTKRRPKKPAKPDASQPTDKGDTAGANSEKTQSTAKTLEDLENIPGIKIIRPEDILKGGIPLQDTGGDGGDQNSATGTNEGDGEGEVSTDDTNEETTEQPNTRDPTDL